MESGIPPQESIEKQNDVEIKIDKHHKVIKLKSTGEIGLREIDKALNTKASEFNEGDEADEMVEVWPNEINIHRYQQDDEQQNGPMITEVIIYFGSRSKRGVSYGHGVGGPNKDLIFFGGSSRKLPPYDKESRLRTANYEYSAWNTKTKQFGQIDVREDYSGSHWGDFKPGYDMEHPANYYGIRE